MQNNLLSHKILDYEDLARIPSGNSSEQLVDVRTYDSSILALYNKKDMYEYTKDSILVRDTLAKKLAVINSDLKNTYDFRLKLVYGYRHLNIQKQYFDRRKAELRNQKPELDETNLERLTHNFVAIPNVAGHPTGGAIDVTLVDSRGIELDMGTQIADYDDPYKIRTFASDLTQEEASHRKLLHDVMVREGFAPFYGEWWHFSFGDREWAAFYNKKRALYSAIDSNSLK